MSFSHSIASRVYFGTVDMSAYVSSTDWAGTQELGEVRTLLVPYVQQVGGHVAVTLTMEGYYDPSVNANAALAWDTMENGNEELYAFLPTGDAVGSLAYLGVSDLGSDSITAGDGAVAFPCAVAGSSDADRGVSLHPLGEETVSGAETGVNNTAPTSNGGAAYLMCHALTGTLDVVIEQSANGTDWDATPLVEFTQLTDIGTELVVVAVDTTVKQYLRAKWTLSVGGEATFFVGFGRR